MLGPKTIQVTNYKDVPVSVFLGISLVVVFLLFNTKVLNAIPCDKNIHQVFMSNFVHIDAAHLIANLYALYALSRVEQVMGYKSFIWLIIFLLLINTLFEFISRKIWPSLKCSIGFSGILFGIMTWEIVSNKNLDVQIVLAIIVMTIAPSLQGKNISLSGHAIGAFSGIVGALLWKAIHKEK